MKNNVLVNIIVSVCVLLCGISCTYAPTDISQVKYRNALSEIGIREEQIDERIATTVQQFFYGTDNQRIYYEFFDDMAYILDVNNNDIRSEGISYGMMLCIQLDMKTEFDRLWKFAHEMMLHKEGDLRGYFAWQLDPNGKIIGTSPAPDGELYFATALFMASNRWGDGEGLYNYREKANTILDHMIRHREILGLSKGSWVGDMIDPDAKQVVFVPVGEYKRFTDPSYHVPHFYELFALWADNHNELWREVAERSRSFFQKATHPETGLAPDYAYFDGIPVKVGDHYRFQNDAWRVAMNISLDSLWWNRDPWQRKTWVPTYLGFFRKEGIKTHNSLYDIDGANGSGGISAGLVAMNATAALIANKKTGHDFVRELWDTPIPEGHYRYFDGCLYLFGLLNISGRFVIY